MNEDKKSSVMKKRLATLVLIFLLAIAGSASVEIPFLPDIVENIIVEENGGDKIEGSTDSSVDSIEIKYEFKNEQYLQDHFEKHGDEFDYDSVEEYVAGANRVIASSGALHKLEQEDGDDVYYLEETNEFVIVSTDGYIRTYFKPSDGKDYYDRQ
ncbi:MAG: hypothetical protein UHS41_05750 [Lachnospiraceae bacterium]|nr:hypothetical protein [Lachnospiraceae bacterium]